MQECCNLIEAILAEDRALRERLARCSFSLRETGGAAGALNFKETLGHLAFWDDFAVRFFQRKLANESVQRPSGKQFEEQNRRALAKVRRQPFPDVLSDYVAATGRLVEFLRENWEGLSERERRDFWVPLQHRRHHRAVLFQSLDELIQGPGFLVAQMEG